jgi:thioredoxin-related protein
MRVENLLFYLHSLLKPYCLMVFILYLITSPSVFASDEITWRKLDSGLAISKESHKLILIDLYTDWCIYCKKLDQSTYTDQDVIKYLNQKFVCIKENAESERMGKVIRKAYRVTGYPCTLVFDEKGACLGKFEGYTNSSSYKFMVERIVKTPPSGEQTNLIALMDGSADNKTSVVKDTSDNSKSSADNSPGDQSSVNGVQHKVAPTIKSLIGRFY